MAQAVVLILRKQYANLKSYINNIGRFSWLYTFYYGKSFVCERTLSLCKYRLVLVLSLTSRWLLYTSEYTS